MKNQIYIKPGERLTLEEYLPIASDTMSFIAETAISVDEIDEIFSITDLAAVLNKICVHMAGEFKVRRMPSDYCQIVYVPWVLNEADYDEEYLLIDFTEMHDASENRLWISEKVLFAFMNRNLYGITFMLYFYLGYRMTQDAAFGISQNICFQRIIESCNEFPEGWRIKHPTTLMRALGDLQDAGLIRWNAKSRTFELLYIMPYDPNQEI